MTMRHAFFALTWFGLAGLATAQQAPPAPAPAPAPSAQPAPPAPGTPATPAPGAPAEAAVPGAAPTAPAAPAAPEIAPVPLPEGAQQEVIKERLPNGAVSIERQVIKDASGAYVNFGHWKGYYPDGRVMGEGEYVQGKRHGKWTRWYAPGEAPMFNNALYAPYAWHFSEAYFDNGVLHGPWVVMDANKRILSVWEFKGGKQDGPWVWYYPTGAKRREAIYAGGQLIEAVNFAPDGKIAEKETWIDGRQKVFRVQY
jgi:antitoxin component YwqK of YwqJK toxin-antitoxin module